MRSPTMQTKPDIDFSSKHHILIRNSDGTLSPLDYPYFQAKYIGCGVWQVLGDGDFCYLVEGEKEALAIDSGYGAGNIRKYLQGLTDRPVNRVANTHDHFDHTANNGYFDKAYMSDKAVNAKVPFPSIDFEGIRFDFDYPVEYIKEGFTFDLGGRILETIEIPDHTESGIAFLDRKGRNLFSGDELVSRFKILNGSVSRFASEMKKLEGYRDCFDTICAGNMICSAEYVERYRKNAEYILQGNRGEPLTEMPEPPFTDYDPQGPLIFDRQLPRRTMEERRQKRPTDHLYVMDYAECRIIYDMRRISE
jgi:glyoxylase-like metal-dependent hydrolase (beta-lactamase superfamily II)